MLLSFSSILPPNFLILFFSYIMLIAFSRVSLKNHQPLLNKSLLALSLEQGTKS
jgi:uncharacterized membrane protein (DUF485 family)